MRAAQGCSKREGKGESPPAELPWRCAMTRNAYSQGVAEWIREQRKTLGISQEELAEAVGVSQSSITNWEAARGMISSHSHALLKAYFKQQRKDKQVAR